MNRLAKLQLIGPVVLSFAIFAEELAAYSLALKPSSAMAWYLNIELFGIFQRSHYVLSDKFDSPFLQLYFVAIPILVLTCIGFFRRRPLMIAAASNLSCLYVFFLAYAWHLVETPSSVAASLGNAQYSSAWSSSALTLMSGLQASVLTAMLIPALLSVAASHYFYIRAVRST